MYWPNRDCSQYFIVVIRHQDFACTWNPWDAYALIFSRVDRGNAVLTCKPW